MKEIIFNDFSDNCTEKQIKIRDLIRSTCKEMNSVEAMEWILALSASSGNLIDFVKVGFVDEEGQEEFVYSMLRCCMESIKTTMKLREEDRKRSEING